MAFRRQWLLSRPPMITLLPPRAKLLLVHMHPTKTEIDSGTHTSFMQMAKDAYRKLTDGQASFGGLERRCSHGCAVQAMRGRPGRAWRPSLVVERANPASPTMSKPCPHPGAVLCFKT